MNSETKFRQKEEATQNVNAENAATELEFQNAEEVIRHDAAQTEVPPVVAERLNESIAQEPKPTKSWWQRIVSSD